MCARDDREKRTNRAEKFFAVSDFLLEEVYLAVHGD